jgi:hypothetical protein
MAIQQNSTHPAGVSGDRTGALTTAQYRKADAALALRQKQVSWAEVAETLGYPTPRHALIAVEKALQRGLQADESKEFMRMLAGQKLEELLYAVWDKATDQEREDQAVFVRSAREILADHAKLLGYLSPAEVSIYNPLESEIEQLVGKFIAKGAPEIETGDIFEMEPDDDGVYREKLPSPDDF